MQKKKAVIFDCDEVLLDYTRGFKHFLYSEYRMDVKHDPKSHDFVSWLNLPDLQVESMINQFNKQSYMFGTLQEMTDAKLYMLMLKVNHMNDVDFIICTKSGTGGHSKVLRLANLSNVFGDNVFSDVYFREHYESKLPVLEKISQIYDIVAFIDDHPDNIDEAKTLNINSILFSVPQNHYCDPEKYDIVHNWHDLYMRLCNILD